MSVHKTRALILRRIKWREHDLRVDLLGEETGRLTLTALAARKSRRRFGAALEIGAQVKVDFNPTRRLLNSCDLVRGVDGARGDLARFNALNYLLEVTRLISREGEVDAEGYTLVTQMVDFLDSGEAVFEDLARWDLAMLAHHGYGLRWDRPGAAVSLEGGGVVPADARLPDLLPIPPRVLRVFAALAAGQEVSFELSDRRGVRGALIQLWTQVLGRSLATAPFLLG